MNKNASEESIQKSFIQSLNVERKHIAKILRERRRICKTTGRKHWLKRRDGVPDRPIRAELFLDCLIAPKPNDVEGLKQYMHANMEHALNIEEMRDKSGISRRDKYIIDCALEIAAAAEQRIKILQTKTTQ